MSCEHCEPDIIRITKDEQKEAINTLHLLMANCSSDASYRVYTQRLDEVLRAEIIDEG